MNMKKNIIRKCVTCSQEFEAKAIYEEAEQDGMKDIFQGYQNTCAPCAQNPFSGLSKEKQNAIMCFAQGLLTRDEFIRELMK